MTTLSLEAQLAALKAENAALKAGPKLTMKIGEKGGLSVYGMGRFPVTLYGEQWTKLLGHREQIEAFLAANVSKLATKESRAAAEDSKPSK